MALTVEGVSRFTLDPLGRAAEPVLYMGREVVVETPPPPNEFPRPKPAAPAKAKRGYKYPEWRRKRANRK